MVKTTRYTKPDFSKNLTVSTETLAEILDCGKSTARKIGTQAGAKISIGRRVLWNVCKIKEYLNAPNIEVD